jgi:hypothetical protein
MLLLLPPSLLLLLVLGSACVHQCSLACGVKTAARGLRRRLLMVLRLVLLLLCRALLTGAELSTDRAPQLLPVGATAAGGAALLLLLPVGASAAVGAALLLMVGAAAATGAAALGAAMQNSRSVPMSLLLLMLDVRLLLLLLRSAVLSRLLSALLVLLLSRLLLLLPAGVGSSMSSSDCRLSLLRTSRTLSLWRADSVSSSKVLATIGDQVL